ncbi:MAG: DUF1579 family protein [Fimbriimonadaceae bacterium]|nr:DUF1579 family protein [Fimbriimonadaceae bacterium]
MRKVLSALALTCLVAASFAQAPDQEPPKEIKDLSWLVGTWTGTSAMDMEGQKADVQVSVTVTMDMKFIKMVSVNDMGFFKLNEVTYLHWDAKAKKYGMSSYTDMADTPRVEEGEYKDGALVTVSKPWDVPGMPEPTTSRSTMKKVSDTEITIILEFKQGDKWVQVMKGNVKKK